MMSLKEIHSLIADNDNGDLKDYYNKCYDNLRELNKRSNQITMFLLVLVGLYLFAEYINDITVLGFKLKGKEIIKLLAPQLTSYFIFEWCLMARRRRDLINVIKHLGFYLFKIEPSSEEYRFTVLKPHTRNAMPFSLMMEILNIGTVSIFSRAMTLIFLAFIFLSAPTFLIYTITRSFRDLGVNHLTVICNIIALYCLVYTVYFYITDIKGVLKTARNDALYIKNKNESNL